MKLLFLLLVLANLALFAWQRGAFGTLPDSGREAERVARQVEPERIRALTPAQAQALRDKAKDLPAANGAADNGAAALGAAALAQGAACVEFGDFSEAQAARLRPRLAALNLGERLTERSVEAPGWYMVYVPPFKSRADVDRAAAQLRDLGVKELLVIADNSPMRYGIALGSFRDPELAKNHLADLERRGVRNARVADRPSSAPGTRFQLRAVDAALAARLLDLQKEFAPGRLTACAG
jgi:SPOR domain